MPQLAWIGLGNIGRAMAKNLASKGNLSSPLLIWNRTASKAHDLAAETPNTKVAASLTQAIADADIIFTCLSADADVEAIISTATSLPAPSGIKNKLFVDCSTIHPDTTRSIATTLESAGASFVACPVFGAPAMAAAGQLVTVLAGPTEAVAKVKPYTKGVVSRADIDFSGQNPAQATLLKVIGNTFILQMVEALGEGHVLAEKTGLGVENLHAFVEAVFPGPYVAYSKRIMEGGYFSGWENPLFHVDLARKDAGHALKLAADSGAKLQAVEVADQHLAEVQKIKGDKGDMAGIYGAIRVESGLPYENK